MRRNRVIINSRTTSTANLAQISKQVSTNREACVAAHVGRGSFAPPPRARAGALRRRAPDGVCVHGRPLQRQLAGVARPRGAGHGHGAAHRQRHGRVPDVARVHAQHDGCVA
jgi:hypothetical protein